jgi:hypothetical protein
VSSGGEHDCTVFDLGEDSSTPHYPYCVVRHGEGYGLRGTVHRVTKLYRVVGRNY